MPGSADGLGFSGCGGICGWLSRAAEAPSTPPSPVSSCSMQRLPQSRGKAKSGPSPEHSDEEDARDLASVGSVQHRHQMEKRLYAYNE